MIRLFLGAALLATALYAIPAGAQAAGIPRQTATVTCFRAHLYLVRPADDRPYPIDNARDLMQGQTLEILSPTRTTLQSVAFYETTIPIVETGPGFVPHYFVREACINLDAPSA